MSRTKRAVIGGGIGLVVAGLVLALGLVMADNARFSDDYVARQFAEQKITFTPLDHLKPAEREHACVVANAGQPLRTGKQAECFANEYIAVHLEEYGQGKTYAELGTREFALRAQLAAAEAEGASTRAMQRELDQLVVTRDILFKGETLRGLLLTSYGFSMLGDKAGQAAAVSFGAAGLLALASVGSVGWGLLAGRRAPVSRTRVVPQTV